MKKGFIQSYKIIMLGLVLAAGLSFAWTAPAGTFPNNDSIPPIDVTPTPQVKGGTVTGGSLFHVNGILSTDGLGIFGNAWITDTDILNASHPGTGTLEVHSLSAVNNGGSSAPNYSATAPVCTDNAGKLILCSSTGAVCGDGTTDAPETCDDGNTTSGDGCSSTCHTETVVNGTCATGLQFTTIPTGNPNLCTAGTPSNITGTGPWNWTCIGSNGGSTSSTCTAAKITSPAPTVTLTANPTSVTSGSASNLTWTVSNATSCTASGGWSDSKAITGGTMSTGNLTSATTFTLTCTNTNGSTPANATVSITAPAQTLTAILLPWPQHGYPNCFNPINPPPNYCDGVLYGFYTGTATGTATYEFQCYNGDSWHTSNTNSYMCHFGNMASYDTALRITKGTTTSAEVHKSVLSINPPLELIATLSVASVGDKTATLTGGYYSNAQSGAANYQYKCTLTGSYVSDGSTHVCNYSANGTYTAFVKVTKGPNIEEAFTTVTTSVGGNQ
jgi:cysteine-rich repeat protein